MKPPKQGEEYAIYCDFCQKLMRWVIWGEKTLEDEGFSFTCEECKEYKDPTEEKTSEQFDDLYARHMQQHEKMKDIEFCHRCGLETCVCVVCEVCGYHSAPDDPRCACVRRTERENRRTERLLTPGANDLTVQFEEAMVPYHET